MEKELGEDRRLSDPVQYRQEVQKPGGEGYHREEICCRQEDFQAEAEQEVLRKDPDLQDRADEWKEQTGVFRLVLGKDRPYKKIKGNS